MHAFGSNIVELLSRRRARTSLRLYALPEKPPRLPRSSHAGRRQDLRDAWMACDSNSGLDLTGLVEIRCPVWISQVWSRHDVRIEDGADARNPSLEGRLPDQPAAIEAVRPPGTSHPHVIGVGDVSPAPVSGRLMRRLAPVNLLEVQSSSRGEARL
ncbi:hypothetical protein B2J93_6615 [Marssonina coronariae]|uniref:Uncharacterized protein n=1 Tax=Diplocarpon coronariae TaxID=2795749 RepID=A0A218YVP1_9HELO|nr:hypothetical protein B2J93_6615 [Marssonina coronariae]